MYILIKHTFCESLMKLCLIKHKCALIFVTLFSDIGQCFHPTTKNSIGNKKSGHVRHN